MRQPRRDPGEEIHDRASQGGLPDAQKHAGVRDAERGPQAAQRLGPGRRQGRDDDGTVSADDAGRRQLPEGFRPRHPAAFRGQLRLGSVRAQHAARLAHQTPEQVLHDGHHRTNNRHPYHPGSTSLPSIPPQTDGHKLTDPTNGEGKQKQDFSGKFHRTSRVRFMAPSRRDRHRRSSYREMPSSLRPGELSVYFFSISVHLPTPTSTPSRRFPTINLDCNSD